MNQAEAHPVSLARINITKTDRHVQKVMTETRYLWGKARPAVDGGSPYQPLTYHCLDVAACADAILMREPEATRERMAAILGLDWPKARAWLLLIVACHDVGKACPGFQSKWPSLIALTGLSLPRSPDSDINHAFVSQIALEKILVDKGWPYDLAVLAADAVGCHHGNRASPTTLDALEGNQSAIGKSDWAQARAELVDSLIEVFRPDRPPAKPTLNAPDFMLLSGLTSFADWIGSNEEWFPYGACGDNPNLKNWFEQRRILADKALDAINWESRTPLSRQQESFKQVFGFSPRPLQQAVAEALAGLKEPTILLVEAPMGEGKTEAAFFAHLEMQRRFGHRGLYMALPTKATGNAMFKRTLKFLRARESKRKLDLQLLHGGTMLNDLFQELRFSGVHDSETGGEIRAEEWFTHKKRALLSEYGIGTIDQALLSILPVRHSFVRLWGLANRVVVFDEIHAYDAYTGTLLVHLLRWLVALGSSVVLLSATLPPSIRRKLAEVVNADLPPLETDYPRLSVLRSGSVEQIHFGADPSRRIAVRIEGVLPDLPGMCSALENHLINGGMGLALVNTVQRAQELYCAFPEGESIERQDTPVGKRLPDGTEVLLFHARFPAEQRQVREDYVLEAFGNGTDRSGRKILIATQVAEQSLDLDFDLILTDLAPIDLVLQRAGRLWRHARQSRPVPEPILLVAGLLDGEPPSFAEPLWWGAVYREDILLRTWCLLKQKDRLILPDEIDVLVQAVYEEEVAAPEFLQTRLEKSQAQGDGMSIANAGLAHQAIIGLPDDASWNDPARFILYDEDQPGVHRTLTAQTRLGEDSAVIIPLWPKDQFDPVATPALAQAKQWCLQAIGTSRKGIVRKIEAHGVPEGWKKSSLLRNCFPLLLDEHGRWIEDASVRLDDDLGLVYEAKEKA